MKIVSIFCLGIFGFLHPSATHATYQHASTLHRLSYTDVSVKMKAFSELNALYAASRQEMNATLNAELRQLARITKTFNSRMEKMENVNQMLDECVRTVKKVAHRSPQAMLSVNDIAAIAIYEKQHVYDRILAEIYDDSRKNLQKIAEDVLDFGVKHDCEKNETCSKKIVEMVEKLPVTYQAEQDLAQAIFLEAEYVYRDRVLDYADGLRKMIKPYAMMMDHCLREYRRG